MIISLRYPTIPPSPRISYRGLTFFGSAPPKTPERGLIDLYLSQPLEQLEADGVLADRVLYPVDLLILLGLPHSSKLEYNHSLKKVIESAAEIITPQGIRRATPSEAMMRSNGRNSTTIRLLQAAGTEFKSKYAVEISKLNETAQSEETPESEESRLIRAYLSRGPQKLTEDGVLTWLNSGVGIVYPGDICVLLGLDNNSQNKDRVRILVHKLLAQDDIRTPTLSEASRRNHRNKRDPQNLDRLRKAGDAFRAGLFATSPVSISIEVNPIEEFCFEGKRASLPDWRRAGFSGMTASLQHQYRTRAPIAKVLLLLELSLQQIWEKRSSECEIDLESILDEIPEQLTAAISKVGLSTDEWIREYVIQFLEKQGAVIKPAQDPEQPQFGGRNPFVLSGTSVKWASR